MQITKKYESSNFEKMDLSIRRLNDLSYPIPVTSFLVQGNI